MRILLGIVAVLVALVATILIVGALLPRHHTVTRSVRVNRPVRDVYRTVRDFGALPGWRKDVKSVDLLDDAGGRLRFRETSSNGTVTYEVMEDVPDQRIVTRIADTNLGYSGGWTYSFAPAGGEGAGTLVSITEDADVANVFFRFMSRFVFGHTATIDKYLADLAALFTTDRPSAHDRP